VISSAEIAQMGGAFQQQYMMQMQHASMLNVPQSGASEAEGVVGRALNVGSAVAGPGMALGLGMAGLDPMSLALKAGMGGSRFGALGAGAAGLGAFGLASGALAGLTYTGGQMLEGARGQQQFNGLMRSTYQFSNPQGGYGFTRGQLSDIGGSLRQMSTESGQAGEMVGFEELGRLATNMGRMGMDQGVRDAKQFTEKFRTMVKSLKEIASEMGTSLEEAQKMMSEMRSSGVFGNQQATSFARKIRSGARAGGLATSELTGMMNIGSQISRSIGGLGSAGAQAGLETMTNIGVAQQAGALSEEDIYNATGLAGAEGRRALATQQLSSTAQFLKGGLGRRFLASVAGKGGRLNEGDVEEYMSGGVGTERTRQMWQKNMSKVGRADFIRNEGRLRGAAMERFGGLLPAMVMKNWLDERGMNLDEGNDRSMIFMQRRLGLGRDEADVMMKQIQALPAMLEQRKQSATDEDFAQKLKQRQSHTGIEGLKHKFEKARADVQATLQQVGADFYTDMSGLVEGTINKLTGNYVKELRRDVSRAYETGMKGGATGAEAMRRTLGVGGSLFGGGGRGADFGLGGKARTDLESFREVDADRYQAAGYNLGTSRTNAELQRGLDMVRGVSTAFQTGGSELRGRADVAKLGAEAGDDLRRQFALGAVEGKGMQRLSSFGGALGRLAQDKGGQFSKLEERYRKAGAEERAQIMATLTESAGIEGESSMFASPEMQGIYGSSNFSTVGERDSAVGSALFGTSGQGRTMRFMTQTLGLRGLASAMGGGKYADRGLSEKAVRGAGEYLASDEGRDYALRALDQNEGVRREARASIEKELTRLQRKGELTDQEEGRKGALQSMIFAQELGGAGSPQEQRAVAQRLAKESGLTADEVSRRARGIGGVAAAGQESARAEAAERYGAAAREQVDTMRRGGVLQRNAETGKLQLSTDVSDRMASIGFRGNDRQTAAQQFLESTTVRKGLEAKLGTAGQTDSERSAIFGQIQKMVGLEQDELSGMSVDEKRRMAAALQGTAGTGDIRSTLLGQASLQARIERGSKRGKGGGIAAIASALGTGLDTKDIQSMVKQGRSASDIATALAESSGVSMQGGVGEDLTKAIESTMKGESGTAASRITAVAGKFQEAQTKQKLARQEEENPLDRERNKKLDELKTAIEKSGKSVASAVMDTWQKTSNAEANAGGGFLGGLLG